ncbi:MAG: sensor histidine kinase [Woeseiaceae bacterium]|nr:sensor histidine kinase [Woeseiaceae bacterium]
MRTDTKQQDASAAPKLGEIVERVQAISAENEKLVRQLADGEHRFRHLAKAVWQVQEEERRSIALELHDGLGQVLTALINHIQHSAGDATDDDNEQSIMLATTALTEVRRMARALRPSALDDLGLAAALRMLARTTCESSGLDVSIGWPDEDVDLDKQSETLVFRIVQEALTNAVKHAEASRVRVIVDRGPAMLKVSITDNGLGFDAKSVLGESDKGFGARGMRDRAELFGGRLSIESEPGEGTSVLLQLPVGAP